MAYDDRWRYDRHRQDNGERGFGPGREGRRYPTDYDRDREDRQFGSRRYPSNSYDTDTFGRGSRDDSAFDRDDRYGTGTFARDDYRGSYDDSGFRLGSDRYQGSRDVYERDSMSLGRYPYGTETGHRSMSERAFGRSGSYGRDYRDHDQSRNYGSGRDAERNDRGFLARAGDEVASWFGDDDAERRRRQDAMDDRYGEHRGRGPKSYQRSDDRIREDVNDRLTDDYRVDASEIEVAVSNREVTLSGTVDTRADKRRAEDIAESVSGVTHVQNNLRVQNNQETWATNQGHTGFGTATGATRSTTGAGSPTLGTGTTSTTRLGDKTTV